MALPDKITFDVALILRGHCRNYHFGELVEDAAITGMYIVTPDVDLPAAAKQEIREIVLKHKSLMHGSKVKFYSRADD